MNDSLFTEGITHFMLIDEQGNALSERLIFVPDHKPNQWQITADQPTYGKREKVSLQIAAKDNEGNPVEGTFCQHHRPEKYSTRLSCRQYPVQSPADFGSERICGRPRILFSKSGRPDAPFHRLSDDDTWLAQA